MYYCSQSITFFLDVQWKCVKLRVERRKTMITFDLIQDKVEFFEATDLATLEKKINDQIEHNKAIMRQLPPLN
ncbi:Uncharacterized conserved protein [Anoxybacillus flavithermus WK1]|uniref:Uncharacterized conserved protein n=1 Tax=Anoxybacillus flavithermus (strain DSM 21510 / WK1) TaxID=491915 RepID=B7GIU5_ANOFW|nr:Uncharacterized conserved protein [Anoxybacillus flavithermus WK1]